MNGKLGIFIIIAFIIAVISVKILFGAVGLLFTKIGLAVIALVALYFWVTNKIDKSSDK